MNKKSKSKTYLSHLPKSHHILSSKEDSWQRQRWRMFWNANVKTHEKHSLVPLLTSLQKHESFTGPRTLDLQQWALNECLLNEWMNTEKYGLDTLLRPCSIQPNLCIMVSIYSTLQMYQFSESSRYAYKEKLCYNTYHSLWLIIFFC